MKLKDIFKSKAQRRWESLPPTPEPRIKPKPISILRSTHVKSIMRMLKDNTQHELVKYLNEPYLLKEIYTGRVYFIYGYGEDIARIDIDEHGIIRDIGLFERTGKKIFTKDTSSLNEDLQIFIGYEL